MQISIQLDDDHAQKLAYIQQTTQKNTLETIQQAIDLGYQQLQERTDDPLAKLKQSSFIGSFEAEDDFAENSENILRSLLSDRENIQQEKLCLFQKDINRNKAILNRIQKFKKAVEILSQQGLYEPAIILAEKNCDLAKDCSLTNPSIYADSLHNLAKLYYLSGQYGEALPLYQKALQIYAINLGNQHPDYANALNNLARLYQSMGQYKEALPIYQQALEILSKKFDHPDYANTLNNLACLYQSMGQYGEALPLYQKALEILSDSLETDPPDYANTLNNLARLYQSMGQYREALPLVQQALEILNTSLGNNHPDYAESLNNLATLYQSMEKHEEALPLYKNALEILNKSLGNEHPNYASYLNSLANSYRSMGKYEDALDLYKKAIKIYRKSLGIDHPDYAGSLNNLALLYHSIGEYGEALPLVGEALEIKRKSLGFEHPNYALFLNSLALLYVATQRPEEALELMQKATKIDLKTISKIFSVSTDHQRITYLKENYYKLERFLSLVFQYFPNTPEAVQSAYNLILRRKAIATETAILQKIALLSQQYAHLAPKLQQWQQIRQQLAKRCFDIPTPEQLPYYQPEIKSLEQQAENLERELNIPELNLEKELQNADFQTIALELSQGTTLIEFIRFNNYNFQAIPANGDALSFPPRYLAFILPARAPEQLTMIDLGEAEPIDKLVKEFRQSVENPRGLSPSVFKFKENLPPKSKLRELIFDQIKPYLTQELMICPDGELNCLPFEILPTDQGGYLMDEYRFNFLNVGRDILRFKAQIPAKVTESLVIANPDYNLARPENTPSTAEIEKKFTFKPSLRDLVSCGKGQIGQIFNSLPGTEIEGEKIAKMLGVKPVTATKALKPLVSKAQKAPYILHIATHGYFLGDITPNLETINQNLPLSNFSASERFQVGTMQNPLLRSGLAFAGVNTMLNGGKLPDEAEDGLLTSLDVQSINLAGTELVVTSACETALGDIHTGETLIGLRRSFLQAGAKTVIISLWKVDDVATTILMQDFYENLQKRKLSKAESLRKAKSSLQRLTIGKMRPQWLTEDAIKWAEKHSLGVAQHLRELSQKSDSDRPYEAPKYWAAFICLGNPAPLET